MTEDYYSLTVRYELGNVDKSILLTGKYGNFQKIRTEEQI